MAKAEAHRKVLDSYARESRKGDDRNMSITGQHGVNQERIAEVGGTLGELLQDRGRSAWVKGVVREGWNKLIVRLESGASDGAVIFDIERLLRRVEDALKIIDLAERGFMIYDSDGQYDLTTPQGQKSFIDAAAGAQYFSHRLSTRVRRGNRLKALNGEGRTGKYRPFGFDLDRERKTLTINPTERDVIRKLVSCILDDRWTWQQCIDWLNENDVCTTGGAPWTVPSLRSSLLAPRMAGKIKVSDDQYATMQGEPIIEPHRWQELHALVESRRGRPPSPYYLCSGVKSPVRCDCGGILAGDVYPRKKTYEDGATRRLYRCKGDCRRTIADQRALDTVIEDAMFLRLGKGENERHLASLLRENEDQRKPHEAEILRIEKTREHWESRLNAGKLSFERYDALMEDLEKQEKVARAELDRIGSPDVPSLTGKAVDRIRDEWPDYSANHKRELVAETFKGYQITVSPGSLLEGAAGVSHRVSAPTPIPRTMKSG
jgi:site-specific DNA recombinase